MPKLDAHDPQFPENTNWALVLDSHKLTDLAERLSRYVKDDFMSIDRSRIPGLRLALNTLITVDKEAS